MNSGTDQVSFSGAMGNINKIEIITTTILTSITKVAFEFHKLILFYAKKINKKPQHPLIVTIIVQDNGRYSAVDST